MNFRHCLRAGRSERPARPFVRGARWNRYGRTRSSSRLRRMISPTLLDDGTRACFLCNGPHRLRSARARPSRTSPKSCGSSVLSSGKGRVRVSSLRHRFRGRGSTAFVFRAGRRCCLTTDLTLDSASAFGHRLGFLLRFGFRRQAPLPLSTSTSASPSASASASARLHVLTVLRAQLPPLAPRLRPRPPRSLILSWPLPPNQLPPRVPPQPCAQASSGGFRFTLRFRRCFRFTPLQPLQPRARLRLRPPLPGHGSPGPRAGPSRGVRGCADFRFGFGGGFAGL